MCLLFKIPDNANYISTEQLFADKRRLAAIIVLRCQLNKKKRRWVHPINERRNEQGAYHNLVQELQVDPERHLKYFRTSAAEMD